jgi:hypothetical protein
MEQGNREELRRRTVAHLQNRMMPSMENFTEQHRLHHESVMRRQMLLAKLHLAQNRVAEISGRRKIRTPSERGVGGRLRGGNWWDVFDPNKNGVNNAFSNAFDPNKNGFTQHIINPVVDAANKVGNEFTNPNSALAQGVIDAANKVNNEFTNPNSLFNQGINDAANKVANEFNNPGSVLRAGTEDAFRKIDNEFTNPDSAMRRGAENAFDPNKNGVNEAFRKVENEFNNPNSDFRRGVGAAAEVLKAGLEGPVKQFFEESFDPNKNGLGDAFRKFGKDTEAAFQEFGNKMASTFSKEEMDRAFAPLKDAFEKFGNATDQWFRSVDPMVWIIVASSVLTIAGTIASFGLAGPALMGANAALISAAGAAVTIGGKAALGRKIDPTDVAGLVLSLLPIPGASVVAGQGANAVMRTLNTVGATVSAMSASQLAVAGGQAINGILAAQQSLPGGVNLSIGFGKYGRRRGGSKKTSFAQKIAKATRDELYDETFDPDELSGGFFSQIQANMPEPSYQNYLHGKLKGGAFNWPMIEASRPTLGIPYEKMCPMDYNPVWDARGNKYSNSCHAPDGVQTFPYNPNPNPEPTMKPFMPSPAIPRPQPMPMPVYEPGFNPLKRRGGMNTPTPMYEHRFNSLKRRDANMNY